MKYVCLSKDVRQRLKKILDSGELTVEQLRHNIEVQTFLNIMESPSDKPIIVESSFWSDGKLYDRTFYGELSYFVDRYEKSKKSKENDSDC